MLRRELKSGLLALHWVSVLFVAGSRVGFFVSVLPGVEGAAITGVVIEHGGLMGL